MTTRRGKGVSKMNKNSCDSYLSRFLQLKCSGDVLNAINPIRNTEKEISESWAILKKIKTLTLSNKMQYSVLDLCAGNAITSVLSAFVLPVSHATATDIRPRTRNYGIVKRFNYRFQDIYDDSIYGLIDNHTIIVSSHPCKHALRIIELFKKSNAKALCLIPCCNGSFDSLIGVGFLSEKLNRYDMWTYYLATLIADKQVKISITTDYKCLSEKRNVIYAER